MTNEHTLTSTPLSSLEIINPDHFAAHGYPHEAWRRRRLEHCELAGPVVRLRSATTGGLKSVPVRYRLRRG